MDATSDRLYGIFRRLKCDLSIIESDRTTDADGKFIRHEGFVAAALSKFGTEVNATNDRGDTLLTLASMDNNSAVVRELLGLGANVKSRDNGGRTPLHWLMLNKEPDIEAVRLLLDHKADVNAKDQCLQTPFHFILKHSICKLEMAELLLKYGADVKARDIRMSTPLHYLVNFTKRHTETLRMLHYYRAFGRPNNCILMVHFDSYIYNQHYKPEVVEVLLKYGADVTSKDDERHTPIDNALASGEVICAKVMINYTLINEYDGDWMKIIDIKASVSNRRYAEVVECINQCIGEIGDMKGHRVNDRFSLYDSYRFVNKSLIPKPLYNTEMISEAEIFKRYPEYGSTLWTVIKPCLDRADLFDQLEGLQSTNVFSKLGTHCLRLILEYIPNNDLLNFISALSLPV